MGSCRPTTLFSSIHNGIELDVVKYFTRRKKKKKYTPSISYCNEHVRHTFFFLYFCWIDCHVKRLSSHGNDNGNLRKHDDMRNTGFFVSHRIGGTNLQLISRHKRCPSIGFCWFQSVPERCFKTDNCIRGRYAHLIAYAYSGINYGLPFIVATAAMSVLYCTVYTSEAITSKHTTRKIEDSYKRSRRVAKQAFLYLASFFLSFFFSGLYRLCKSIGRADENITSLYYVGSALYPLQGFLNCLVYWSTLPHRNRKSKISSEKHAKEDIHDDYSVSNYDSEVNRVDNENGKVSDEEPNLVIVHDDYSVSNCDIEHDDYAASNYDSELDVIENVDMVD